MNKQLVEAAFNRAAHEFAAAEFSRRLREEEEMRKLRLGEVCGAYEPSAEDRASLLLFFPRWTKVRACDFALGYPESRLTAEVGRTEINWVFAGELRK